jgi:LmbE family N-acetylglucosaminyl deacetylase
MICSIQISGTYPWVIQMGFDFLSLKKSKMSRFMKRFSEVVASQKNRTAFPSFVETPPGSVVAVLAPHPDDDVLGCGGTLVKHRSSGHSISTITFTDGSLGDPSYEDMSDLIEVREEESQKAAALIGISRSEFLREKDQELKSTPKVIERLNGLFEEIKPDLVYLPFLLDNHPDHLATNVIFYGAVEKSKPRFSCCFYETWTPLFPNMLVDISNEMDLKIKAIEEFKSQLKQFDYVRIAKGLNSYRSMLFGKSSTYAEAFYLMPINEYLSLFQTVWE